MPAAPRLEGPALDAVDYRGGHLQIIASAGSGKTEVVSQRVASLLADGVEPAGIVAFTFTERAAEELKHRISLRVEERLGPEALDRLGGLFVGTIHAYCFRFLQQRVPRFETYDVLDDHQLTGFLSRGANQLGIRQLDPDGKDRMYASIAAFLPPSTWSRTNCSTRPPCPSRSRGVLLAYYDALEHYRLLTYGQQVARAVEQLERPEIAAQVHAELRHLIVDEYQDVNPAQERLIRGLTGADTHLCVVGDDDQAIYQWRGSEVANIITFAQRYPAWPPSRSPSTGAAVPPSSNDGQRLRRTPSPAGCPNPWASTGTQRRDGRPGSGGLAGRQRGRRGRMADLLRRRPPRRRPALPRHRHPGPGPGGLPEDHRGARHLRHPGPAGRAHRSVRPARGQAAGPDDLLAGRHRLA